MNDTIYRQAAVDAIEKLRWDRFTRGDYFQVFAVDALEEAALIIEHLPSAQQEQRWIPVLERLPEDGVSVLVCCDGDITDGVHDDEDWWIAKGDRVYSDEEGVIDAWMPLPEPYKGEIYD